MRCRWLAITRTDCAILNLLLEPEATISEEAFKAVKHQKTLNWLKICVNTESTDAEAKDASFYFALRGVDREEDVRRIIWGHPTKKSGKRKEMDSFFKGDTPEDEKEGERRGLIYLEFLATWFLKRYDLRTAGKIICRICSHPHKSTYNHPIPRVSFILLTLVTVFFVVRLIWNTDPLIFGFDWKSFKEIDHLSTLRHIAIFSGGFNLLQIFELLPFCVAGFIFVCWGLDFTHSTKFSLWFKMLIPRMLSGIIVGYMPLLFSKDTWEFALKVNRLEGAAIVLSALLFSLYYLFTEIQNVVQNTKTACYRGLRIWLIGLGESFMLGIIAQDLLARPFIGNQGGTIMGLLGGLIYPKILLLFTPLALLIGIFVQVIWEDKPITHPL